MTASDYSAGLSKRIPGRAPTDDRVGRLVVTEHRRLDFECSNSEGIMCDTYGDHFFFAQEAISPWARAIFQTSGKLSRADIGNRS